METVVENFDLLY